jgi:hypothetical protein
MFDRQNQSPQTEGSWLSRLSANQLLGYGCLITVIAGAIVMYCAGTISIVLRPTLLERSTPTEIVRPTLVPTPTQQAAPTFMNLPPGTLQATPTQAPIPTREPTTITPTIDLTNPAPTTKASVSPGPRTTATVTPRP